MDFNYNEDVILWTYRLVDSVTHPSRDQLVGWDRNLYKKYDKSLNKYLKEYGIPVSEKSRVLMLTVIAEEPSIPMAVRNACEYYIYIRDREWESPV